ncbi:hypothetical protein SAMN03159338_4035 [Sphingomonas sp. NFR04]|uniref:hypothetical protein n=1 Tax=Sphingomonas sp. NFR04 TaxID=1566283 RepID=UPI0008E17380|nr:hypothetical protein [Sphingomonas sp. NFR04]SFK36519.1 hypothetical protein SAMN03159338_4035 [Sphingomonas sp. NFR04]
MPRLSTLFVAAEVAQDAIAPLDELLRSMACAPGQADPANPLVPFGAIAGVQVARFVVLEDPSLPDRIGHSPFPPHEPTRLALLVDGDGSPEELIDRFVAAAAPGLTRIFRHCDPGLAEDALAAWMRRHQIRPAATYANRPDRASRQIREEAALHDALLAARLAYPAATPEALWPHLEAAAAAVPLTPVPAPGLLARLAGLAGLLLPPLLLLAFLPLLLLAAPVLIVMLRRRETTDPVIAPRPVRARNAMLSAIEDHDVANQYSAIGTLKPGRFRRWLTIAILAAIGWGAHHLFRRGRLGRVNTIHFASWTFLDDKRRVFFASNYDGSREAYNDDFINKVAYGLNLSFSNGLGYPRTDWLILGGARHEQDFKWYLFHHQIPTQLWYNAFRGLTAYDMARNARLRAAFEARPTGTALHRFVAEI